MESAIETALQSGTITVADAAAQAADNSLKDAVTDETYYIIYGQIILQAISLLAWLIFFWLPFLPNNEEAYSESWEEWVRRHGQCITYSMIMIYNYIVPAAGIITYGGFILFAKVGLNDSKLESTDIWLWSSLYPLICLANILYYRFLLGP